MAPKKIVIKKYENRRLYDTARSQYVNLDEVAQLVRDGNEVQVLDAATGEDLTRLILTQIIVEHAKSPDSVFPLNVLRQMVVASGRVTQEGALNYIKAAFEMYQTALRAMSPALNPFDFISSPREPHAARPSATRESDSETAPGPRSREAESTEVAALRRRVEELEGLLSTRKPHPSPRSRKPPGRSTR